MAFTEEGEFAPGAQPPSRQDTKGRWLSFIGSPEGQAALIQFGASMLTPRNPGQPFSASLGQAVGDAAEAVGRVQDRGIAQSEREREQRNVEAAAAAEEQRSVRGAETTIRAAEIGAEATTEAARTRTGGALAAAQLALSQGQTLTEKDILDLALSDLADFVDLDTGQLPPGLIQQRVADIQTALATLRGQAPAQGAATAAQARTKEEAIAIATAPQIVESIIDRDITLEEAQAVLTNDPQKLEQVNALLNQARAGLRQRGFNVP